MTILDRIYREPAALLGALTAVLGILTLLGVLDAEVAGSLVTAAGALVALLRYVVTPSAEVVVQRDLTGGAIAGAALKSVETGAPVAVDAVVALPSTQTGEPSGVDRVGRTQTGLLE